jgi:hypothetical protein
VPDRLPPGSLDGSDSVYVRPIAYEVTVWPPGTECIDSITWCMSVVYRGHGLWAVVRGSGDGGPCLNSDGQLVYERRPSERDEEWLAKHRFPLNEALRLARDYAPKVNINDMTAVEVLARHQARHPDGCDG